MGKFILFLAVLSLYASAVGVKSVLAHGETLIPYQRCIVASTDYAANCSTVFNASATNPDPYFIADGPVYPTLQMALDECPFSPVMIEIHGTVLASDNLTFTQNKDLIIRGVRSHRPSKILRFSNVLVANPGHFIEIENIILEGCNANHSVFTEDGLTPCVTNHDLIFMNAVVQNYNGSVAICQHPTECHKHRLVVDCTDFLNITHTIIDNLNVKYSSIVGSSFCPCSDGTAHCIKLVSTNVESAWDVVDNKFCAKNNQTIGIYI